MDVMLVLDDVRQRSITELAFVAEQCALHLLNQVTYVYPIR